MAAELDRLAAQAWLLVDTSPAPAQGDVDPSAAEMPRTHIRSTHQRQSQTDDGSQKHLRVVFPKNIKNSLFCRCFVT